MFAYCARYGKQPLSELRQMTLEDLFVFVREISEIVKQEKRRED